jgi:hypothetical protein
MLSDMDGAGTLQSRTMTAGGASASTATTAHPGKDVVPDAYPRAPTATTEAAINAGFTYSVFMLSVYGPASATAVLDCTAFNVTCSPEHDYRAPCWSSQVRIWAMLPLANATLVSAAP